MVDPIPLRLEPGSAKDAASRTNAPYDDDIGAIVGPNLKRFRTRRGHSLESLAKLSGVSRAMLSQIELGRSVPSINIVFKIARAFDVPFSALLAAPSSHKARVLPADQSKVLTSASGEFSTRALFPFDAERKTEFYELRLTAGGFENADAHSAGTVENLVVVKGRIEISASGNIYRIGEGDALWFQADQPHNYRNLTDQQALIYLVMTYSESLG
jgi:transcriptional regulator with XRE-family HTH domain